MPSISSFSPTKIAKYFTRPPTVVMFGLVNLCNLKCPFCALQYKPKAASNKINYLSEELFLKALPDVKKWNRNCHFVHFGEALMHPQFFDFVNHAKEQGLKSRLTTNGVLLNRHIDDVVHSNIDAIKVSVDSVDPEMYKEYRVGTTLDNTLKNLSLLYEAREKHKAKFTIQIQFIAGNKVYEADVDQEQKVKDFQRVMAGKADSLTASPLQSFTWAKGVRYKIEQCGMVGRNLIVMWNGRITSCCHDEGGDFFYGDLNNNSLKEIWTNSEATFQKLQFQLGKKIHPKIGPKMCRNCYLHPPFGKKHHKLPQSETVTEIKEERFNRNRELEL